MNKRAISVTLSTDNLLWLRGRAMVNGKRSVSATLDEIIERARLGGKPKNGKKPKITSVVGTISISVDDPDLLKADESIGEQINQSLDHTTEQLKGWGMESEKPVTRKPALGGNSPERVRDTLED